MVCGSCSTQKFLLPSQSSKPLRVCDTCYTTLTKTVEDRANKANETGKKNLIRPLSTVHESSEESALNTPPPRPPPPLLFPTPIQEVAEEDLPELPSEEVEIQLPDRPPRLYELVQMSQEQDSFDLDDADWPLQGRSSSSGCFMRQNSNSFWWDANDDHHGIDQDSSNLDDIVFEQNSNAALDPFPSTISATIYTSTINNAKDFHDLRF